MADYTLTIQTLAGVPLGSAQFSPPPKQNGQIYQFEPQDTISLDYQGHSGEVVNSVLLLGRELDSNLPLPFEDCSNQIDLVRNKTLTIAQTQGIFGFSVSFAVQGGGNTSFYFVPDPELQVGST